jgi:SH3-like domain-containing protein
LANDKEKGCMGGHHHRPQRTHAVSFFVSFRSVAVACTASLLVLAAGGTSSGAPAGSEQAIGQGPSGLPLPRFVSLKSGRVNSRVGPGVTYSVDWLYLKSGLPMEIIQEYDNWRKVRDADGSVGWVNQSLLSGKRTAITAPWQRGKAARLTLLSEPAETASAVAYIEPGVVGTIKLCNGTWCEMTFDGHTGWMDQAQLWGAYPGETIKD